MLTTISETLKARRQERGYTLKQLSARTGISLVSLTKYEKGRGYPNVSSLYKLCTVLELDYNELYTMLLKEKSKKERNYGN